MTIHVTIDEAERRLAELVEAAVRGEDVLLDQADGRQVRLVPVTEKTQDFEAIAAKRRQVIGLWQDAFVGYDTSIAALKSDNTDPDERFRRKFGPAD